MSKKIIELKTIVDFCRRKGIVYQGSEIYGGLANTWDYGPMGVLIRNNIKSAWRSHFITERVDMVEIDAGILMNSKVWEASGHVGGFSDCMVDCKSCKSRFRADHLIEGAIDVDVEGWTTEKITQTIVDKKLKCPKCKEMNFTEARYMNLMFETNRDKIGNDPNQKIYLRPETAQGIFVNFKNVLQSERMKLPFGIGQIGKAFRNEITPGNFNFRIIELEQMEIEYFINPPATKEDWNGPFEEFLAMQQDFMTSKMGFKAENIRLKEHNPDKLSHYSKRTCDIEYNYPFGFSELSGLAYRTDFDLSQHSKDFGTYKQSNTNLEYLDSSNGNKVIPHCIEPTVGVDRLILASLVEFYNEEELEGGDVRVVMKFPMRLAPYKVAILPLMKKEGMAEKATEIYISLKRQGISCDYDDAGSIGKRYRRQDENGTPWCMCIDFDTMNDDTVTMRNRDTMEQVRINITEVNSYLK